MSAALNEPESVNSQRKFDSFIVRVYTGASRIGAHEPVFYLPHERLFLVFIQKSKYRLMRADVSRCERTSAEPDLSNFGVKHRSRSQCSLLHDGKK